ncbi:MAG: hypothetical protein NTX45_11085 [Proteobacteria bacterium]|nr:hypothetical protein [Pseudomonadota bacterium]
MKLQLTDRQSSRGLQGMGSQAGAWEPAKIKGVGFHKLDKMAQNVYKVGILDKKNL